MSVLRWIGFSLMAIVWAAALGLGVYYAVTDSFASYHLDVIELAPAEIPDGVTRLYFAMLSSFGGALILISLLAGALLFGPARAGRGGAFAVVALGYGGLSGFMAFGAWKAGAEAGAVGPVAPLVSVAVACAVALVLWLSGSRPRRSRFSGARL